MDINDLNFDVVRRPEVMGTLVGILIAAFIVGGGYLWLKKVDQAQEKRIAWLESEIERLRPPSDTPETDWQRIMREMGAKQKIFWGRRLLLLTHYLPKESWITGLDLVSGSNVAKRKKRESGFNVMGAIYAPDKDLNLAELGDYILDCLDDNALMEDMQWWRVRSLVRSGPTRADFEIVSPR